MTWNRLEDFDRAFADNKVSFPVFVKPRAGSGSVGARKIGDYELLKEAVREDPSLIIQEFMDAIDLDADVYIDTITHEAVAAFSKKKIETRIGGASKTVSFKDEELFAFISRIVSKFKFNGPVDMDFFYKDGQYYLSEVNPRFGGGYPHAYECGVNHMKMITANLSGDSNKASIGDYKEGIYMMKYNEIMIR
jgi:carbamoyl-phosphate synthase large subunit